MLIGSAIISRGRETSDDFIGIFNYLYPRLSSIPNSAFLSTSDFTDRTCEQSPLEIPERQERRRNRNETSRIGSR